MGFMEGTFIRMADGSTKAVQNIQAGDIVYTPSGVARVSEVLRSVEKTMLELKVGDFCLRVTEEHPILAASGWTLARNLDRGIEVLTVDAPQRLSEVKALAVAAPIYNFVLKPIDGIGLDAYGMAADGIFSGDWTVWNNIYH